MSSLAIQDALAPIRARFLQSLRITQREIQTDIERALNDPDSSREAFRRIGAKMHKISGSAGTLGFAEMGERAHLIDSYIIELLKYQTAPPSAVYLQVIDFLEMCLDVADAND